MTKPITAWAIEGPDGGIYEGSIRSDKDWAIEAFVEHYSPFELWPNNEAQGYRAVKVQIKVIEDD